MSFFDKYSREELIGIIECFAKNMSALDGVWFQSVEAGLGMDAAMKHDVEVWDKYAYFEAIRYKRLFGLPDEAGIDGLEALLPLHFNSIINKCEVKRNSANELEFRTVTCRVQEARERKQMGWHPCKPAGVAEYSAFARAVDARIRCECLSCFPEVTDSSCACAWRFWIEE